MKPPPKPFEKKTYSVPDAAELLGVQPDTVWRAITKGMLPAYKRGRTYFIHQADLTRVGPVLRAGRSAYSMKEPKGKPIAGDIASECFDRFAKGQDPISIIRELRQDPNVVDRLWDQWLELQRKFAATHPSPCVLSHKGPCSGPPSLNAMLCAVHAETATVLTPKEETVLSGKDVPIAVRCEACHAEAPSGVCVKCIETITVKVEHHVLVVRIGAVVLKAVPVVSVEGLRAPASASPAPASPVLGGGIKAIIDRAKTELGIEDLDTGQVMATMAQHRFPIEDK